MTITGQSSLGKDDIDRMVRDAEAHAADDRPRREEAEVRNQADSLVYQTEKMLKDQASSFSGEEKEKVETDLATLKEALAGQRPRGHQGGHREAGRRRPGAGQAALRAGGRGQRVQRRRRVQRSERVWRLELRPTTTRSSTPRSSTRTRQVTVSPTTPREPETGGPGRASGRPRPPRCRSSRR